MERLALGVIHAFAGASVSALWLLGGAVLGRHLTDGQGGVYVAHVIDVLELLLLLGPLPVFFVLSLIVIGAVQFLGVSVLKTAVMTVLCSTSCFGIGWYLGTILWF